VAVDLRAIMAEREDHRLLTLPTVVVVRPTEPTKTGSTATDTFRHEGVQSSPYCDAVTRPHPPLGPTTRAAVNLVFPNGLNRAVYQGPPVGPGRSLACRPSARLRRPAPGGGVTVEQPSEGVGRRQRGPPSQRPAELSLLSLGGWERRSRAYEIESNISRRVAAAILTGMATGE
jgi:hypothetical protein